METRTAHLDVTGMTCANCSGTVGDAFESLDGVIEANANFATDEGSVEYDPDEVSLAEIYETIEDAGYGAVSDTVTIGISDMTCANCVQTNETALEDTPGVIAAEANFATDEAQVRYNPADTSLDALYDAIEDAGYSPVREDSDSGESGEDARDTARQGEIRKQLRLTLFGAIPVGPDAVFPRREVSARRGILPETVFGVEFWVGRIPVGDTRSGRARLAVLQELVQRAGQQQARQHGRSHRTGFVHCVFLLSRGTCRIDRGEFVLRHCRADPRVHHARQLSRSPLERAGR